MKREQIDIDIDTVVVKQRVRTDNGNLDSLVASIQQLGLLYPIVVDRHGVLIAGGRRLEACKQAGSATIRALQLDLDYKSPEALAIQADENLCRLPLSTEDLDELIRLKRSAAGASKGGFFTGLKKIFQHD